MFINNKVAKFYQMNGSQLDMEAKNQGVEPYQFGLSDIAKEKTRNALVNIHQESVNKWILLVTFLTLIVSIISLLKK